MIQAMIWIRAREEMSFRSGSKNMISQIHFRVNQHKRKNSTYLHFLMQKVIADESIYIAIRDSFWFVVN